MRPAPLARQLTAAAQAVHPAPPARPSHRRPAVFGRTRVLPLALAGALLAVAGGAGAQSACSSDGQPAPSVMVERFLSADCDTCWRDPATPPAPPGAVALDWVLPGTAGEDAPLAAVARRESLARLAEAGLPVPYAGATQARRSTRRGTPGAWLRVAHGLPLGGYLGTSIRWRMPAGVPQPLRVRLALVEQLPAGTEGSPVARNLVRNVLEPLSHSHPTLSNQEYVSGQESRPMNLPEGTDPARVAVIGWLEDAGGRLRAVAFSRCAPR